MGRVLGWAVALTVGLVALEFLGGALGGSIALTSDALHNLTDLPPMVLALLAIGWSKRSPTPEKTFGYHRVGILAAFVNALLLALAALFILWESFLRLRAPQPVGDAWMLWVSVVALAINGGITLALARGRRDLNLRAIFVHNLGDALSNVAILAGALAIRWNQLYWVDGALGMGIGALVLWSSWGILRESSHVLLEGKPREIQLEEVAQAILRVEGVNEVHDVHIWTLGTDLHALSCHVRIPDMHMEESEQLLQEIRRVLEREFHITHVTVQLERAGLPRDSGYHMPAPVKSGQQ
ncbi:MAG TPA: cation diffusion facilitator family transporter [Candidatus Nitrosotenuis sp.]|nr:cation diffusion facilitator family transporter [Candidatus Nitrosotenuis sp.]